jgi:Fe-S cluster biogenesis protein NfuA
MNADGQIRCGVAHVGQDTSNRKMHGSFGCGPFLEPVSLGVQRLQVGGDVEEILRVQLRVSAFGRHLDSGRIVGVASGPSDLDERSQFVLGQVHDKCASHEWHTEPVDSVCVPAVARRGVRPAVARDGGDITFHSWDHAEGVVRLNMRGSCAGCPSSTLTLKQGIENMLRHYVPEVQAVEQVV